MHIAYVEQNFKVSWWDGTVKYYLNKLLQKYNHITNIDTKIQNIVKTMDIRYLLNSKMSDLTPGQLRWVVLAANIAADTKVLFIDEYEQHLGKDEIKKLNKNY